MTECTICERETPEKYVEKHHLTPCSRGGKDKEKTLTCIDCGDQVHRLFTNKELERDYYTLEKLLAHPKIQKWKKWVKNKRFGICMKRKKKR